MLVGDTWLVQLGAPESHFRNAANFIAVELRTVDTLTRCSADYTTFGKELLGEPANKRLDSAGSS